MSGHSKWATTKRHKAVIDSKRAAVFTKIANIITIAAREKGGDPTTNFSLRMAMDKGRAVNMPKDNIERAIKRGTGEGDGAQIEEIIYEGIGPVKSQFIIKCLTDSRNRTASEVRHIFSEYGGALSSVMWNFSKKGVLRIMNEELQSKNLINEEFELELIDAGAQDILKEEEGWTIYTKMEDLVKVKNFLESKNLATESADIEYVAKDTVKVENAEDQEKMEKFIEELENNEDVSDYYTNAIT
ncbi:MAG: YebC/PmpR family DNA-binding transcriptional regulator [Patescibacteria group bacterium]|nr:YebC/PmpR family DNA-binding transcriptional regulator [Patescibacteria group bacterium]MDD4610561.1 YebC/PmpR family DNA-binding transcriptional regulator [Patescibacteria group bacterium]